MVRERGARAFTSAEQSRLTSLIPYFAFGLRDPGNLGAAFADRGRTGLIMADRKGCIHYANSEGMQLLTMAARRGLNKSTGVLTLGKSLSPELMHLCNSLCRIANGEAAPPPSKRQITPWGCFEFRASWLLNHFDHGDPLIAIIIELRVPRKLALLQAMHALGLSDRQKDVCLLLADCLRYEEIARRAGVRLTTVVDHVDKIYFKLGVRDRASLLSVLLAERRSCPRKGGKQLLPTRLN